MAHETRTKYMSIETVAEILCCSDRHIYRLIIEGKLEAIKIGNRAYRVSEKSLEDFIEKGKVNPEDFFDPDIEKKEHTNPHIIARSTWMSKTKSPL